MIANQWSYVDFTASRRIPPEMTTMEYFQ